MKVPGGTNTGQKLRLAKRGLPKRREGEGDLFAIVQIVVPPSLSEREKALFKDLADTSGFNPRTSFPAGGAK
jgi:curved DNA-binding protein